jgi:uncharacterized membrane protein YagU involved in acid resistance
MMAEVNNVTEVEKVNMGKSIKASLIGGAVAGVLFGILMQMMGKISMIAMMMGSESLVVGWIIHMMISLIFGAGFGVLAARREKVYGFAIIYGIVLWVIGPLLIMPAMMGMGIMLGQAFTAENLMNLMTHIVFALILAFVYKKSL